MISSRWHARHSLITVIASVVVPAKYISQGDVGTESLFAFSN